MSAKRDFPRPVTAVNLTAEARVLLSIGDPRSLAQLLETCDWVALDRLAREQRLTGRLLSAVHQAGAMQLLPQRLRLAWRRQARHHAAAYRSALGQLDRLAATFGQVGVTPTVLKGPVLVLLGIRRPWERPFGDLDLLIRCTELPQATSAMKALGYAQSTDHSRHAWARISHYHDPRWHHPEEPLPVEVHWDLLRPDDPLSFDVDNLATQELTLPSGRRLHRPDDADLLAHVCLHFWGDRAAGEPRGIAQLWDVADLASRLDAASWERLWSRATQRGHNEVFGVVLALVRVLLDRPELERFPAVAARSATPDLRAFANRRVCGQRPAHIQLLGPRDDVHFGVGRHLKQRFPWAYGPRSPLHWWSGVVLTRLVSAALRSGSELGRIYGVEPSLRLRLTYLRELGRLVGRAALHPRATAAELRIDRWALRITPAEGPLRRRGADR